MLKPSIFTEVRGQRVESGRKNPKGMLRIHLGWHNRVDMWRRLVLTMLLGACAAILGRQLFILPAEPRYRGRSLTAWLDGYGRWDKDPVRQEEAGDAIRHIGTNAIPHLLARLRYEVPSWRFSVASAGRFLGESLGSQWYSLVVGREAETRLLEAEVGFEILGPTAAPAVPELIRLLDIRYLRDPSAEALAFIGAPALEHLAEALTNRSNSIHIRRGAARALVIMGTNGVSLTHVLITCLEHDPEVAHDAVWALCSVNDDPKVVVPVLTKAITSSSAELRYAVVTSLGNFGSNDQAAVNVLVMGMTDESVDVRRAATNALEW